MSETDPRRSLPSVQRVLEALEPDAPEALRRRAARDAVDAARDAIASGGQPTHDDVCAAASENLARAALELLGPVINATGVLLHTNLGRAPLGESARRAIRSAAGYTNVEYRLADGRRGSRHDHVGHLLAEATGAEAAMVVNNNAAAVLLVLSALARDREVIVSRGELVEIGGGFRIPEIMAETGARLIEVGTTNRTRLADYQRAIRERTAMLLKVHPSNYRMIGFVEDTPVQELAELGPPVVVDAGSGLIDRTTPWLERPPDWLVDEPGVRQCIEAGAKLVMFSGDKLLGGPQAGIIVGERSAVQACARHPIARALRVDKLALAGLQALALDYLAGDGSKIGIWDLVNTTLDELRERADAIARDIPDAKVVDTQATTGGGTAPEVGIESVGVAVSVDDTDAALAELRRHRVVARAADAKVVCDLRTVDARDDRRLTTALRLALSRPL